MLDNPQIFTHWTNLKKYFFLFFFVYFIWHIFFSADLYVMLFGFNLKIAEWIDKFYLPLNLWVNKHILHFQFDEEAMEPGSVIDFSGQFSILLFSLLLGTIWFLIDRKRKNYNTLNFYLVTILRISLSIITFSYGIDKLIPVQMPTPNLYQLTNGLGYQNNLLWTLMGVGKTYQVFTGFVEVLAAIIILFNRTYVLGLLILFGVYVNVCMMNYAFDIGVLYFALFLLIATLFLLFPYLKKLYRFFVTHQPINLKDELFSNFKLSRPVIFILGALIVTSFSLNTIKAFTLFQKNKLAKQNTYVYKVETHINNNDTLPAIENDNTRWRYWMEYEMENKKSAIIFAMDINNRKRFFIEKDILHNKIILTPQADTTQKKDTLFYTKNVDGKLVIKGNFNKQEISIYLKPFAIDSFPLLKRKPHFLPTE